MCSFIFDVFNGCSLVKKEIGKEMSNISYREKLIFSKLVRQVNFSEWKFQEMHWLWRAKKYKVYSGKRLFWHYCLQLPFVYKTVFQISFNLFCSVGKRLLSDWEIKGFYQSSLRYEVNFMDIMNVSQIYWLNIKISNYWDMVL